MHNTDIIADLSENFIRRILEIQEGFLKDPENIAMMVYRLSDELQHLGVDIMRAFFEAIDRYLNESSVRKSKFYVEQHSQKKLITSLGTVDFEKTLFSSKECRKEMYYIFDQILGLESHQQLTEDAGSR